MTEINKTDPGDPSNLNAQQPEQERQDDIVSVNKKGSSDNKLGKAVFILVVGGVLVGVMAWFSQDYFNARKAQIKASSGPKAAGDTSQVFNPEKTGNQAARPKIGAESGSPATSHASERAGPPTPNKDDGIRPLRGSDGKVMVNAQGRAMGVDKDGNVVEVPAITAMSGDQAGRKPLPGEGAQGQAGQPAQGGQQPPKPPSRYAGSLFVGDPAKPTNVSTGQEGSGNASAARTPAQQAQQIADIIRTGLGGGPATTTPMPSPSDTGMSAGAAPDQSKPGTVGNALYSSATQTAVARRTKDQNLILPKGRQADCTLNTRIVDEVAGFTSCVLAQNLYSDNGRVLLLERGSELSGEYGITNQLGLERLFVTWNRLKTPEGIEVDLSSPGADRLGTSGVPGHLDSRWGARIGAAFLLSFVKDVTVAVVNSQSQRNSNTSTSVSVQTMPGQNMMNSSSQLAEEVIKQTIKVRPRMTINEGDRISVYVARDLDFTAVYALKAAGSVGTAQVVGK
uniref:TrbI/VirB10 family protein n=1 Tax=Acidovorax sp. SUPP3334 TaxID=2920881 RepID=UPI002952951D|nr:TrbI/VirB10 family protein [Acidovorax sp. SUPP3334]BDH38357.1 TrbI/VirB10 family protein [Acidovorax sp. SUPP3334]